VQHVFLLIVLLGDATISSDMHFESLERCNWFAANIVKRYGNYPNDAKHKSTAYCRPVKIDPNVTGYYK
jgi:hypothetical protein